MGGWVGGRELKDLYLLVGHGAFLPVQNLSEFRGFRLLHPRRPLLPGPGLGQLEVHHLLFPLLSSFLLFLGRRSGGWVGGRTRRLPFFKREEDVPVVVFDALGLLCLEADLTGYLLPLQETGNTVEPPSFLAHGLVQGVQVNGLRVGRWVGGGVGGGG